MDYELCGKCDKYHKNIKKRSENGTLKHVDTKSFLKKFEKRLAIGVYQ